MSATNARILDMVNAAELQSFCDAATAFTRVKMYRLTHIPAKYLFPPLPGEDAGQHDDNLKKLVDELRCMGCICLDRDGEPVCLSGKPPVVNPDGTRVMPSVDGANGFSSETDIGKKT